MAKPATFDITSTVDLQEVDNAVNQARKEVQQRYDFKGATAEIEFSKKDGTLKLLADDDYKLTALVDVIQSKLIKRGVPIRNLDYGEVEQAFGGKARQTVTLVQGISVEKGKEIVRAIKDAGFKKVNAQIQDEQVRVTSASIDGTRSRTSSASSTSASVGAPYDVPLAAASVTARTTAGCAWPRMSGPQLST